MLSSAHVAPRNAGVGGSRIFVGGAPSIETRTTPRSGVKNPMERPSGEKNGFMLPPDVFVTSVPGTGRASSPSRSRTYSSTLPRCVSCAKYAIRRPSGEIVTS